MTRGDTETPSESESLMILSLGNGISKRPRNTRFPTYQRTVLEVFFMLSVTFHSWYEGFIISKTCNWSYPNQRYKKSLLPQLKQIGFVWKRSFGLFWYVYLMMTSMTLHYWVKKAAIITYYHSTPGCYWKTTSPIKWKNYWWVRYRNRNRTRIR